MPVGQRLQDQPGYANAYALAPGYLEMTPARDARRMLEGVKIGRAIARNPDADPAAGHPSLLDSDSDPCIMMRLGHPEPYGPAGAAAGYPTRGPQRAGKSMPAEPTRNPGKIGAPEVASVIVALP